MLSHMVCAVVHSRVFRAFSVVTLALAASSAPCSAQSGDTAQLTVFVNGTRLGEVESTVRQSADGWTISSSSRLAPPLDLVTREMTVRYGTDWAPLGMTVDAVLRGAPLVIRTRIAGTSAASDITQAGQTFQKTDAIAPGALLLPNMFFAALEALALRLAALESDTGQFAAYIVPQGHVQLQVSRLSTDTIETQHRTVQTRRFAVAFAGQGAPLQSEVWVDERGRLLRFDVVAQGLVVAREDISSVATRRQNISRAGDERVSIPANGFNLIGTVSKPSGTPDAKGRFPAVILVAGSGVSDRDETVAGIPIFGQIAGMLADAGFLVVRYDKRGVGQSGGRSESATLADYADDVLAVFRFLDDRKDVDGHRIAVFGHSEGAWVALLAASRQDDIAALALAASPSGTGGELILEQQQTLLAKSTLPEDEKQSRVALQRRVQAAVLGDGDWTGIPDDLRKQADTPWFRSLLAFDPAKIIGKVRQPIVILQGERDTQVLPRHADKLAELARTRKKVPPDRVQVVKLPGVNHLLVPAETGDVSEYGALKGRTVSPEVGQATVAFLRKQLQDRK